MRNLSTALDDDDFNDFGDLVNDSHLRALEAVESILGAVRRRASAGGASTPPISPFDNATPGETRDTAMRRQSTYPSVDTISMKPRTTSLAKQPTFASRQATLVAHSVVEEPAYVESSDAAIERTSSDAKPQEWPAEVALSLVERRCKPRKMSHERKSGRALPSIRRPSATNMTFPKLPLITPRRQTLTKSIPLDSSIRDEARDSYVLDATSVWRDHDIAVEEPTTPPPDSDSHPQRHSPRRSSSLGSERRLALIAENEFVGFCRGASSFQQGNAEAFKTSNHVLYLNPVPYDHCSECGFLRWMSKDSVQTFLPGRLQYRWTFLAKCHVPISGKRHNEEYGYKCLICAMSGKETPTIFGADWLLMHVALNHHGEVMEADLAKQTRCINDYIAHPRDMSWDINLVSEANGLNLREQYVAAKALAEHRLTPLEVSYLPSWKWFKRQQR